jgi:flavin-dependent dehydrogenase
MLIWMKEVMVVGGGTAGLVVAHDLAMAGIDVTVFDSGKVPGEHAVKASGLLSKDGLERTRIPYKGAIINMIGGAVLHAGRASMRVRSDTVKAYVLDRALLAQELHRYAADAGAKLIFGKRITNEELLSNTDKIIIGADGAVSTVASTFGFPPVREYILTYKAEYKLNRKVDPTMVELFFNRSARRLFGWTIPYSESLLEAGIGISSRSKKSSADAFREFATDSLYDKVAGATMLGGHASQIPIGVRSLTVKGNVALVGDAAGQVKATTGGGVIFGALCARILARSVYAAVRDGRSLSTYERAWRKLYGRELAMHSTIHSIYSGLGPIGMAQSIRIAKLFGFDSFLSKYGDMDRPSLMVKRFFLRGLVK